MATTEKIKALAKQAKKQFFKDYANIAYVNRVEYLGDVIPKLRDILGKMGFEPRGTLGPVAVLLVGEKVGVIDETGEIQLVEEGEWKTYQLSIEKTGSHPR